MDGGAWWAAVRGVAKESDTTERLHFHFSLSCIGEGNGNPLQCTCLENLRDGGALVGCRLWGRTELDMTEETWRRQQQQVLILTLVGLCFSILIQFKKGKLFSPVRLFVTPFIDYTVHGISQARILEWVACPFSRWSSQPRDQTQVSHIAGRLFSSWATRHPFVPEYLLSTCSLQYSVECCMAWERGSSGVCFMYNFCLFIYFWLHWVIFAAHRLPLAAASWGYSLVVVWGLLAAVASRCTASVVVACGL